MKIWFFVEGESEFNCLIQLIRKFYPNLHVVSELPAFINMILPPDEKTCFIFDCGNIERIPYEINDQLHNILKSNTDLIVVFGDIEEKLKCATNRIQKIQKILDPLVSQQKIKYVLSRPTIESIYWHYPDVMKKTIKVIYAARRSGRSTPLFQIPEIAGSRYPSIKDLMKSIGNMSYKKPEFANCFFPRIASLNDFEKNETLRRLKFILNSI